MLAELKLEALPNFGPHPISWNAAAAADAESAAPETLVFRECEVMPGTRTLLRRGKKVEIGSRAFDLLVLLVRARGQVVSKEEIFRSVWPTTTVDECNLRFQVASLRKALGRDKDLVKTIPGRGYFFAIDAPMEGAAWRSPRNRLPQAHRERRSRSRSPVPANDALASFFDKASELVQSFETIDELLDALSALRGQTSGKLGQAIGRPRLVQE